jgi:hypothetical protein
MRESYHSESINILMNTCEDMEGKIPTDRVIGKITTNL